MNLVLTGSIAFDYSMTFPGYFSEHFLPDRLDKVSLSFLVDSLTCHRGGIAANIAYTLALLGERPKVMATVGEDFEVFRVWLEEHGVDTSAIEVIPGETTASFFVTTDQAQAQIASFFTGAMAYASKLSFSHLAQRPDLAMISPNDPEAMVSYIQECRQVGIPYIYDPSQQIVRLNGKDLRSGIEGCQALFTNDYEFGLIEEKTGLSLDEIRGYADFVITTRGEEGTNLYTADREMHIPVIQPHTIPDPTGAGDAFRGGFLKGYMNGLSLERCGQMGTLAATYCLEADSPMGHSFSLEIFKSRFREHFDDQGELDQLK
ncbi:MAG TPA: carbohydrate kinase family protein [Anaerolineae bacterium]|nr:carbohydrate kinase family protein [Anaerolineae bacterium]